MKHVASLILGLFFFLISSSAATAEDIVYTEKQIIRNADFRSSLYTAWHVYGCDVTSLAGKGEEGGGLRMEYLGNDDDRYAFQMLTLPTTLTSARFAFDYQARADIGIGVDDQPVILEVSVASSKDFDSENLEENSPLTHLGVLFTETISAEFEWRSQAAELDPTLIEEMQEAHAAGEHLFLQFAQRKTSTYYKHGFYVDIDNVALSVSGRQEIPVMKGRIAYMEKNEAGASFAISTYDPNTDQAERIWTHPKGKFDKYSNLAWKPDGTELAFVSDHDFNFSIFRADIFAIRPDGSGLHRLPGYPLQEDVNDGRFPKVTVQGAIRADSGTSGARYTIIMGIQGTDKGQMVVVSEGETVSFTIPEVPVIGDPAVFDQPIILQYWGGGCSAGIEYAFPSGLVAGGSVDLGTFSFFAANCAGIITNAYPTDLSWKRDGSEIGFAFAPLGLRKFSVDATTEFEIIDMDPNGGSLSSNLAWSPVDDRFLYEDFEIVGANHRLFIAEEGGEPSLLLEDYNGYVTPVWLPDGSGFLYVGEVGAGIDEEIFEYDLTNGKSTRLTYFKDLTIDTLSISPDGRHIVFEIKEMDLYPVTSRLWIMDRLNPVEIWPITDGGNYINPDWSRKDVVLNDTPPDDDENEDNGNGRSGGGGSGGCFILNSRP
jgi:hypothetical protein